MFDVYIWIAIFLMIFSTSFSAVYLIGALFTLYLLYRWLVLKPKRYKYEIMAMGFTLFFISTSFMAILSIYSEGYVGSRLSAILNNLDIILAEDFKTGNAMDDMSSQVRLVSAVQTFYTFLKRPVFGYSIMSIEAHSCFVVFLSSVGIFGLYCWLKFYFLIAPLRTKVHTLAKPFAIAIVMQCLIHTLGGDMRQFYGGMLLMVSTSFCFIYSKSISNNKIFLQSDSHDNRN